jgi:hypothetical protein
MELVYQNDAAVVVCTPSQTAVSKKADLRVFGPMPMIKLKGYPDFEKGGEHT